MYLRVLPIERAIIYYVWNWAKLNSCKKVRDIFQLEGCSLHNVFLHHIRPISTCNWFHFFKNINISWAQLCDSINTALTEFDYLWNKTKWNSEIRTIYGKHISRVLQYLFLFLIDYTAERFIVFMLEVYKRLDWMSFPLIVDCHFEQASPRVDGGSDGQSVPYL